MNMSLPNCLATILLAIISCTANTVVAQQNMPGTFADGHNPGGPPDPTKETKIWKVDPITGSVSITIPFLNVRASGRGPFYPYSLQYNSAATFALSTNLVPQQCMSASTACTQQGFTNYYTAVQDSLNSLGRTLI
jgi:hypothetical protein